MQPDIGPAKAGTPAGTPAPAPAPPPPTTRHAPPTTRPDSTRNRALFPQRSPPGHRSRRGTRARPPRGNHPPRHQAGQPDGRRQGPSLGHRLRPGPAPERQRPHGHRRCDRNIAVHEPGASPGQARIDRRPHRHLLAGRDALRADDLAAGLREPRPAGIAAPDRRRGAAIAP